MYDASSGKVCDFENVFATETTPKPPWKKRVKGHLKMCLTKDKFNSCFLSNFPFITLIREYDIRKDLPLDFVSGLAVGIMHIQQGIAYALIATLPPICGLYTSFFGSLVYFFLGTSRQASVGCLVTVALMLSSVLDTSVGLDPILHGNITNETSPDIGTNGMTKIEIRKIHIATSLSFLSGLIMVTLGKLRLGWMSLFMPDCLVGGFTTGIAVHIVVTQMIHVLGIDIQRHHGVFKIIKTCKDIILNTDNTNVASLVTSVVSMVILYLVKVHVNERYKNKLKIPIPVEVIVVTVATIASHYGTFKDRFNISVIENMPAGIPKPDIPDPTLAFSHTMDAVTIGMVAFVMSFFVARILAKKNNHKINPDQEMVAYGAGSIVCSIFSGYIPAASLARSMVQDSAGGRTQVASLIGCLVVVIVILFVGPLLFSLPKCVLSAVIIVSISGLFLQISDLPGLWRKSRIDFSIWIVTFLCTVILDADIGIFVGVQFSLLTIAFRTQRPLYDRLAFINGTDILKPAKDFKPVTNPSAVRIVQFQAPVYFANYHIFVKSVIDASGINPIQLKLLPQNLDIVLTIGGSDDNAEQNKTAVSKCSKPRFCDVRKIILDFSTINFIDLAGVEALRRVYSEYASINVDVLLAAPNKSVLSLLKASDFYKEFTDSIYIDVKHALKTDSCQCVHL